MAAENVTIAITIEYNPADHNDMPVNNFIYHFLTRVANKYGLIVKNINYKDKDYVVTEETPLSAMPLKVVDSLDKKELPENYKDEHAPIIEEQAEEIKP